MGRSTRSTGILRAGVRLLAVAATLIVGVASPEPGNARQELSGAGADIRVVHGVANAGPLDVYVDGAIALIGIGFGDTSGGLALAAGEHTFAVVASGGAPDAAIAEGQITLEDGTSSYAALLGAAEEASVGLYVIDERSVDAGRARFRVVSGVPDAGEITPTFTGGDALSEPLGFGDASQYAAIDGGVFDLEMLDTATGGSLLSLPQTPFAEGTATDVILIGQVGDGTLQALVTSTALEAAPSEGWVAGIFSGACGPLGPPVADLGVVREGQGALVGTQDTPPVAQVFGLASISFAALTASPHVVAVIETESESTTGSAGPLACGEIGGLLTDTGSLVIAMQASHSEAPDGVAVLAPSLEDPDATGVSVFLTGVAPVDPNNELEPVSEEDAD